VAQIKSQNKGSVRVVLWIVELDAYLLLDVMDVLMTFAYRAPTLKTVILIAANLIQVY